jgi:hypothetical protein
MIKTVAVADKRSRIEFNLSYPSGSIIGLISVNTVGNHSLSEGYMPPPITKEGMLIIKVATSHKRKA